MSYFPSLIGQKYISFRHCRLSIPFSYQASKPFGCNLVTFPSSASLNLFLVRNTTLCRPLTIHNNLLCVKFRYRISHGTLFFVTQSIGLPSHAIVCILLLLSRGNSIEPLVHRRFPACCSMIFHRLTRYWFFRVFGLNFWTHLYTFSKEHSVVFLFFNYSFVLLGDLIDMLAQHFAIDGCFLTQVLFICFSLFAFWLWDLVAKHTAWISSFAFLLSFQIT